MDMFKDNLKLLLTNKINECTKNIPPDDYNSLIVNICLAVIDEEYRNHLSSMDYLRQSIGLRGYAQKNPKNEYKRESFEMFNLILMDISKEILKICCRIRIDNYNAGSQERISPDTNNNFANQNISRNALCPCGSGKKYKRCCGKLK
jgi:preprotein translocase subunit SecA